MAELIGLDKTSSGSSSCSTSGSSWRSSGPERFHDCCSPLMTVDSGLYPSIQLARHTSPYHVCAIPFLRSRGTFLPRYFQLRFVLD